MAAKKYELHIGTRQNKLTIMSSRYKMKRGKLSHWYWFIDCKCDCGNTIPVYISYFVKGKSSCGCKENPPKPIDNLDGTFSIPLINNSEKFILVDSIDVDLVSKYRWSLDSRNFSTYAMTTYNKKPIHLHRMLPTGYKITDHINSNGLDNRRKNLRPCSHAENCRNKSKLSKNTSGYIGVYKYKDRWTAQLTHNNKTMHLGIFKSKIEAAKARDKAAILYHGEFAKLNFPEVLDFNTEV